MIWYILNTILLAVSAFFVGMAFESYKTKAVVKKTVGRVMETMFESVIELLQNDKTEKQVKSFLDELKFKMMMKTLEGLKK